VRTRERKRPRWAGKVKCGRRMEKEGKEDVQVFVSS
jgi:hypothetical protein